MITKAAYIRRRSESLRALDMEIAQLTEYADSAMSDVALAYYEAIDILQTARDKAALKLAELKAVGDQEWTGDPSLMGMEKAWNEMRDAVLCAISVT